MAGRNWLDTFGKAKAMNANADLDRGYEAALLIQSLELEYYGDRPIRPDLELSVPSSVQATVLRKFRAAINGHAWLSAFYFRMLLFASSRRTAD